MRSKLLSILKLKCPQCRKPSCGNPYRPSYFNKVNDSCPHCKLNFKIEPRFLRFYLCFYGLGVGISIAIYLTLLLLGLAKGMIQSFIIISIGLILLMPYINALSKVIWAGFSLNLPQNTIKTNIHA